MAEYFHGNQPDTVGRRAEEKLLRRLLVSNDPQMIVVYGRRRVGKTYLIRQLFQQPSHTYFEVTGQHASPMAVQLGHFQRALERVFYDNARLPVIRTWEEGFELLAHNLERRARAAPNRPLVVFLDELPWLATRRSRLLPVIDHCYNTRLSQLNNLRLILCGSAASFMIDKFVNAKGGLHNRVTHRLRLEPFSLGETQTMLRARGVRFGQAQVLELYMALGGIPYYLMHTQKGLSARQTVAELCFSEQGVLRDEFPRLFASLFEDASVHETIVRALGQRRGGLQRGEIVEATGLSSGGRLARRLRELEEAGFITSVAPFGNRTKQTSYRLTDEYVSFYLKWITSVSPQTLRGSGANYWLAKVQSPGYRAWAGYAFEGICLRHARKLRAALGVEHVATEMSGWRYVPKRASAERGAQVDLLFDRDDGVITICEMKYSNKPFKLSKSYALELKRKLSIFMERTRTRKDVQLALVTTHGLTPSIWSEGLVDRVVTLDDLF